MEGIADSTTITYSKLPAYLQPYTGSTNNSVFAYGINDGHVGYTPVRYTTATISIQQLRSTHLEQNERERHLDDRGITPSPSGSSSSGSPTENNTSRDSFLPSNFETQNPVPPTPSDSAESSDRDSPNPGDRLSEGLLVRIPRKAVGPAEDRTGGTSNSLPTPASPSSSHGITVNLLDKALWQMFNSIGNEMIVTKPGRRLFPSLMVGIRGLDHHTEYTISLRISSADPYRYKFLNMQWVAVGESEVMQNEDRQIFPHPNSSNTGQFWMKKPISFKQVKISHNPSSKYGNVLLHTMHKYVMEIVIEPAGLSLITIPIPDTEFMAVTAYQNTKITQLKIENNPFAKGFRDREDAGFHHPSTMLSSALPLPSLYGSPSGHTPIWHRMPTLACRIPPVPITGAGDVLHSRSPSPEEGYRKQPAIPPSLPAFPQPPPYPYFPPTPWPTIYPHPDKYCSES